MNNIPRNTKFSDKDAKVILEILKRQETPEAIIYFSKHCRKLSDYNYWFLLATLWVSYTGFSDLKLWRRLFNSRRPRREESIMKSTEQESFQQLPQLITVYRAHRAGETDWIAYTTDKDTASRFAKERKVTEISEYIVKKKDVIGYFTRREESEIIMLHPKRLKFIQKHKVTDGGGLAISFRSDLAIYRNDVRIKAEALRKGNRFRLYEPSGAEVTDGKGNVEFTATSEAYPGDNRFIWKINIEVE